MKLIENKIKYVYETGLDNMVVLISTRVNGKNYVMASGTTAEVSHKPPLLLTSISPFRYTHNQIFERKAFAVNILTIKQKNLAKACGSSSGRNIDKFEKYNIKYTLSKGDLPFIDGCFANIGCKVIATHKNGDHTTFVGEMIEARVFGERTTRHLLLSDMTRLPSFLYCIMRKIPIYFWLRKIIS